MFEQSLVEHSSGVSVLAAPEAWEEARHISSEGLKKVVRFGRAMFPDVVVDLNPFWLSKLFTRLQESTTILLLFRLDFASIRNVDRLLSAVDRASVDRGKIQLVASRYGRPKEISVAQAETVLGDEDPALPARRRSHSQRVCQLRRSGRDRVSALCHRESDRAIASARGPEYRAVDRGRPSSQGGNAGRGKGPDVL